MSYYEILMRVATTVKRFKMYPFFELAHYILVCNSVRNFTLSIRSRRIGKDAQIIFDRDHPLASWFGSILMCFAGNFLGNFLLGEPLITPLQNTHAVILVTIVWYLTNFCPFDLFARVCSFAPVLVLLNVLKEIRRAHSIDQGLNFALKVMPNSYLIPLAFGILKGTASNHMKVFQRLSCGVWQPSAIELINPSMATKYSIVAGTLLLLYKTDHLDSLPESLLYLLVVCLFLTCRILLHFKVDPFRPVENLLGCLLTGGILDSFRRAVGAFPPSSISPLADLSSTSSVGQPESAPASTSGLPGSGVGSDDQSRMKKEN